MIKAIETQWKGYRFRSRLEARWAVFFERMGWRWEYEPQGFEKEGVRYLPDFQIHPNENLSYWVEVKGDPDWLDTNKSDVDLMHDFGGILPGFRDNGEEDCVPNGLLLLGQIPEPNFGIWHFPIIGHRKGTNLYWRAIHNYGFSRLDEIFRCFHGNSSDFHGVHSLKGKELDFQVKFAATPRAITGIDEALSAARSARFEHGEAPAWS